MKDLKDCENVISQLEKFIGVKENKNNKQISNCVNYFAFRLDITRKNRYNDFAT